MECIWSTHLTSSLIKQVFTVFLSAFVEKNHSNQEELTQYFQKKVVPRLTHGHLIHLVEDQGQIVGFALFEKWAEHTYYLAEMAISPAYQRRGLGKTLIQTLFSKDPSTNEILLVTMKTNLAAHRFYEAIGFKPSSFQHPDYPENFIGYEYLRSM